MRFDAVSLPAVDPDALSDWYGRTLGVDIAAGNVAGGDRIELGETTLDFRAADTSPPLHLAFRTLADIEAVADWVAAEATILPVDGEPYRRFEFLDAETIYFPDAESNVLECLCYDGDPRQPTVSGSAFDGITEVGLPARETLALVEWLENTVGLSAWGSPSETFAWVGDRHARFVVVPAGRPWYPTDRTADIAPVSATVADDEATSGTHAHPTLPYEITVLD